MIGSASWNQIVSVDELPAARPHTVTAREAWHTLGGTSAGKALHLAQQGVDVMVVAMVGDDDEAELIRNGLRGAHLQPVLVAVPGASESHLNLVTAAGERLSVYLHGGPEPSLGRERERVIDAARAARIVVADLMPLARGLLPELLAMGARIWTDVHDYDGANPYHDDFIEAADVVLMNDDGAADAMAVMTAIRARGARTVVCTRGALGAIGIGSDGGVERVEAFPARVIDTNGAGDAFMAGMAAWVLGEARGGGELRGESLRAAMAAGAAQAVKALESRHIAPR